VVTVTLELAEDGCLRALRASGHAGGAALGTNVACAAVTVLLRTTARVLSAVQGLVSEGGADSPGHLELTVCPEVSVAPQWLRGVTDCLVRGVSDLAAEFPGEIAVRIR
jgi:uncharacterized protein YsxB (DUF464 family)